MPELGYINPEAAGHLLCRDDTRSMVSLSDLHPSSNPVCYARSHYLIDRVHVFSVYIKP